MSKIDGYNVYQSFYESSMQTKKTRDGEEVKKSEASDRTDTDNSKVAQSSRTDSTGKVELSDAAQKLLEELKEKYSNMDFIISDYSSEEEAQELLSRGTKEYSVLMDPETLEKMAADEDVKAQYLDILDQSTSQLDEIKEQLEESGEDVKRIGFTVDSNGQVSYFAELEKSSKAQSERIEAAREKKKAQKKEEEEKAEEKADEEKKEEALEARRKEQAEEAYQSAQGSVKRTTVTAATTEELLEKIKNVDWDTVAEITPQRTGAKFDFSV
jgi:anti-sigma28 factor (negative regulator of flagellin synthesis)